MSQGWDWRISARKGGIALGAGLLTVLVTTLQLVPQETILQWLLNADVPRALALALAPILWGAIKFAANARKHSGPSDGGDQ